MPIRFTGLLCGGLLLVSGANAFAAGPIDVHVRVEGATKTLVSGRTVTLADAPIIKDGNPDHSCGGLTALGALQAGTGGDWTGTWYDGLGYTADTIKGFKPAGSDYFELWVNHKLSSVGLCGASLSAGGDVLLFVQHCTYDPKLQACPKPMTPLAVRAPKKLKQGHIGTLRVVAYTATGKATAQRAATVYINGKKFGKTDKHGQIHLKGTRKGHASIYAIEKGHAKSEVDDLRIT
jgi:hypothetical protein